ncbi:MAG: Fe-S cluster assembly protein SufD [Phycisphaerales bacterium]|nr:Fe-S cluster assembly protein SufD [Phycisphaerales bacterium]
MSTDLMTDSVPTIATFSRRDASGPLHDLRREGLDRFEALGFPTARNEAWTYTNVKSIAKTEFTPASLAPATIDDERLEPALFDGPAHRIVIVNGVVDAARTSIGPLPPGAIVAPLSSIDPSTVSAHLGRIASLDEAPFVAMNTALLTEGVVVRVPRDAKIEHPVHVVHVTVGDASPVVNAPRTLVIAERGGIVSVVESFISIGAAANLTTAVTEVVVDDGASVRHDRVQMDAPTGRHISTVAVREIGPGTVTSTTITLGGALVRNHYRADLDTPGADCTFNGLAVASGTSTVDHTLRINHNQPHGSSWQFFKNILDDAATGSFCGRIYVAEDAQKTDAKQTNKNMILSGTAHAYTRPQLEIFADDVKCTHGATIGRMEPSQLFYLRSRGIDPNAARRLLIFAFANETLAEVGCAALRARLEPILLERLSSVGA